MTAVENSFNWWRKDMFFSAAEEVQDSSDLLESVYRAWERERRDGFPDDDAEELRLELQTSLGTTKWQLEEFEKAIKLSYQICSLENTVARHRQFVVAIQSQISRIEKAIGDSLVEDGKQPFRWVQLNEDECDDLALFLSAPSEELRQDSEKDTSSNSVNELASAKNCQMAVTVGQEDGKCELGLGREVLPFTERATYCSGENSSSEVGEWKIVISHEKTDENSLEVSSLIPSNGLDFWGALKNTEIVAKLRWFRHSFRKLKDEESLHKRVVPICSNLQGFLSFRRGCYQLNDGSRGWCKLRHYFRRVGALQRHVQCSQSCIKFSRPLQLAMICTLMIFFMAPFVVYS